MRQITRSRGVGRLSWCIEFKATDLWVGVYWERNEAIGGDMAHQAWVCVVPMIPIHFRWKVGP